MDPTLDTFSCPDPLASLGTPQDPMFDPGMDLGMDLGMDTNTDPGFDSDFGSDTDFGFGFDC